MDDVFDLLGHILTVDKSLAYDEINSLLPGMASKSPLDSLDVSSSVLSALAEQGILSFSALMAETPQSIGRIPRMTRRSQAHLLSALLRISISGDGSTQPDVPRETGKVHDQDLHRERSFAIEMLGLEADEVMSVNVAHRILAEQGVAVDDLNSWLDCCGISVGNGQLQLAAQNEKQHARSEVTAHEDHSEPMGGGDRIASSATDLESANPDEFDDIQNVTRAHAGNQEIRSWARRHGYVVGDRGRIPSIVHNAYIQAMGRTRPLGDVEHNPASQGQDDRVAHEQVAALLDDLAVALGGSSEGITLGAVLSGELPLSAHAADTVRSILAAKLEVNGWAIDAIPVPNTSNLDARSDGSVSRRATLKDRAWNVLQKTDHPLTSPSLASRMGEGVNERSLKVQLANDSRFVRSDVDSWALSDWGLRRYTGIQNLIAEEIDKAGGSALAEEVVKNLTREFTVKNTSIRQMMCAYPFVVQNGIVRRATDAERPQEGPKLSDQLTSEAGHSAHIDLAKDLGLDF
ncbi:histone-like nucleoid-structuring protein Lsr2 [Streptomyces sp. MBT62]|uniref:Lsr2 family DNA-binding protein n=1 Tax=Streptomyces sp. MBT62 TaxID=2800410 RepID=UPI00190B6503|nr:histone-like nucleoid-structuring protein Lsr2 [Streptomyces sp. MBT62]MBK3562564.1 Lsr2 family protein [Streptomyces sp. MBT62]